MFINVVYSSNEDMIENNVFGNLVLLLEQIRNYFKMF